MAGTVAAGSTAVDGIVAAGSGVAGASYGPGESAAACCTVGIAAAGITAGTVAAGTPYGVIAPVNCCNYAAAASGF